MKHVWDCPNEWIQLDEAGHLNLPEHYAGDPDPDSPAYFINARHSVGTSFTYAILSPAWRDKSAHMEPSPSCIPDFLAHYCCPVEKLLVAALAEWDDYEKSFREKGMVPKDAPYIPYPYTKEYIEEQYEVHKKETSQVAVKFGWDCHGLPVEYEIDKKLNIKGHHDVLKIGIDKYNEECRGIVQRFTTEWRRIIERVGRWIDFDNDYKTMDRSFMESCWWVFKQLFEKGLVYRAFRVMPYSTACTTPLSNFEVSQNYKEVSDPSIIVQFKLTHEDT
eukprot:s206_g49.t1